MSTALTKTIERDWHWTLALFISVLRGNNHDDQQMMPMGRFHALSWTALIQLLFSQLVVKILVLICITKERRCFGKLFYHISYRHCTDTQNNICKLTYLLLLNVHSSSKTPKQLLQKNHIILYHFTWLWNFVCTWNWNISIHMWKCSLYFRCQFSHAYEI